MRVEAGDAAAATGDRGGLELRKFVAVLVDDLLVSHKRFAADDEPHLERGAAHVGGDDVLMAELTGERERSDDAAHGPGAEGGERDLHGLGGR